MHLANNLATRVRLSISAHDIVLIGPAVLLLVLFCYLPVMWIAIQAFSVDGHASAKTMRAVASSDSFLLSLRNTAQLSFGVVVLTVLIGYPLAYVINRSSRKLGSMLTVLILFPFWTSTLVRTYAWVVILQRDGVLLSVAQELAPGLWPVSFLNSRAASLVGMVHIMLPYFVLPLLGVMDSIRPDYVRAATSLGATSTVAFWTVFFPLSLPGLLSSIIIVFTLSVGFYVIPMVLGGGKALGTSLVIERALSLYPGWAVASSMGVLLLLSCGLVIVSLTVIFQMLQRVWR